MARPFKRRRVCFNPEVTYFKPRGIPVAELGEVILTMDELEAIRLADLEGTYRQTFGNIVKSARRKIATALVEGRALRIEGGVFTMSEKSFECGECRHEWSVPYGTGRPDACPQCSSPNLHRAASDRGPGRGRRAGRGRGRGTGGGGGRRAA
jgi:predicted DNA-binding protein (UPF0251 family)